MAQKRSKQEIGERLLLLKEKQEVLTEQLNTLLQELDELALPFAPKEPKTPSLITLSLVAQVLREYSDWIQCGEIAEQVLQLQGKPQCVDVGDGYYKAVNECCCD